MFQGLTQFLERLPRGSLAWAGIGEDDVGHTFFKKRGGKIAAELGVPRTEPDRLIEMSDCLGKLLVDQVELAQSVLGLRAGGSGGGSNESRLRPRTDYLVGGLLHFASRLAAGYITERTDPHLNDPVIEVGV